MGTHHWTFTLYAGVYEISAPKGRPRRREHGATLCGEALGLYGGSVNVNLDRPGTSARHAYFRDTLEEIYHVRLSSISMVGSFVSGFQCFSDTLRFACPQELWQPGSFLSNAAEAIRTSIRASSSTNGAGHGRDPMLVFPVSFAFLINPRDTILISALLGNYSWLLLATHLQHSSDGGDV